ncbi:MAG: hypothetical protein LBU67_04255 [Oscillospiraceae bacterium]|jgi:spore maturation protein SpmB|nr:hypothetical protein [Oscillospiraceae bacterium]
MAAMGAGLLLTLMLGYPAQALDAARQALTAWALSVAPALLPYLVCCQMLWAGGLPGRLGKYFRRPMAALLGCPGEAGPLALLAWLGGSPAGARLIIQARDQGQLTLRQGERLAFLTGTMSPMFLLATLPGWAGLPHAGGVLLLAHWLGAALAGVGLGRVVPFSRSDGAAAPPRAMALPASKPPQPAARPAVAPPIMAAVQACLTVGACMAVFGVVAQMARCLLPGLPPAMAAGLHALLEVAGGAKALAALPLPPRTRLAALAGACSFGGFSILSQNAAFLKPAGVRIGALLAMRCCHALAATGIAWALC